MGSNEERRGMVWEVAWAESELGATWEMDGERAGRWNGSREGKFWNIFQCLKENVMPGRT